MWILLTRAGPGGRCCRLKISSWKRFEGLVPKWSLDICASSLNCVQLRHWITLMLLLNQIRLMLEEVVLVDIEDGGFDVVDVVF